MEASSGAAPTSLGMTVRQGDEAYERDKFAACAELLEAVVSVSCPWQVPQHVPFHLEKDNKIQHIPVLDTAKLTASGRHDARPYHTWPNKQ